MAKVARLLLILVAGTSFLPFAHGQDDGSCTVPLILPSDIRANLDAILSESVSGTPAADIALAAPLVTVSPVADGEISAGEYPNTCFFSFADRENPGNPYPQLDTIEDNLGDEDVSLNLHLAHTDGFLFLGFEVTDEFLDLDEGTDAFRNDSIELFINADLEIDDFNIDLFGRNPTPEGFQIVADAAGDGDFDFNNRSGLSPLSPADGPPGEGEFVSAGLPTATGYVVEFQIPMSTLDTDSDDYATLVPAKTGDVLLMNAVVNDNDFDGANNQDTHAMLWVVEDDPRSPFGGGENVWVVPLQLTESVGEQSPRLFPGDSTQDLKFDQLDLVQVQVAATYLSGTAATWGQGDWDGAPGGKQGEPPPGDGFFNQLDIIAALAPNHYLTGPYAAVNPVGTPGDEQTSIIYDASTGELSVDAPASTELTSINIDSAAAIFTGQPAQNLGGSFDNDADNNIFKATFGSSFGSLTFGAVAQAGLSEEFVLADLTVIGSLAGGGDLGNVDLIYIPEPAALVMFCIGAIGLLWFSRIRRRR